MSTIADPDRSADIVIFAAGGGRGHVTRALCIADAVDGARSICLLVPPALVEEVRCAARMRGKAPIAVAETSQLGRLTGETLVVDTFAGGPSGEVSGTILRRYRRRVLVARYRRGDDSELRARYDTVVIPYPASTCEWRASGRAAPGGIHVGYILRASAVASARADGRLLVVDPGFRANATVLRTIRRIAAHYGMRAEHIHRFDDPMTAERYLVVGAGYNLFYEMMRSGVDARFLPVEKRFDDQSLRAVMFGRAVTGPADVAAWLSQGACPAPLRMDTASAAASLREAIIQ